MSRDDIAIALLWLLTLVITVAAIIYGFTKTLDTIVKLVAAIVGLASLREQRLELQRQKQQNYAALVAKLAPFVRNPPAENDDFATVHLYSLPACSITSGEPTTHEYRWWRW